MRGPGRDQPDGESGSDRSIDYADFLAGRYAPPVGIAPAFAWTSIGALGQSSDPSRGGNPRQSSWAADFVVNLGQNALERNPNVRMKLDPLGRPHPA